MPGKEPRILTLEEFAELADAPEGRGGQVKKINWEAVLDSLKKRPMSNASVFNMIVEDKESYMFNAEADDPNPGTIWTQLKKWVQQGVLAKKKDSQGNIFYGPVAAAKKSKKA